MKTQNKTENQVLFSENRVGPLGQLDSAGGHAIKASVPQAPIPASQPVALPLAKSQPSDSPAVIGKRAGPLQNSHTLQGNGIVTFCKKIVRIYDEEIIKRLVQDPVKADYLWMELLLIRYYPETVLNDCARIEKIKAILVETRANEFLPLVTQLSLILLVINGLPWKAFYPYMSLACVSAITDNYKWVRISDLKQNREYRVRSKYPIRHVIDRAKLMAEGNQIRPVKVISDGTRFWLVDGWFNLAAAERLPQKYILATVSPGRERDALLASTKANPESYPWFVKERKLAVELLLDDPEFQTWPVHTIAAHVGCSPDLVSRLRREHLTKGTQVSQDAAPTTIPRQASCAEASVPSGAGDFWDCGLLGKLKRFFGSPWGKSDPSNIQSTSPTPPSVATPEKA